MCDWTAYEYRSELANHDVRDREERTERVRYIGIDIGVGVGVGGSAGPRGERVGGCMYRRLQTTMARGAPRRQGM